MISKFYYKAKKLLLRLWRPRRVISYDVATWADTSSNQASKDPGKLRRGYPFV